MKDRKLSARWAEEGAPWRNVAVSPGGDVLVAGNHAGEIVAWCLDTLTELARWASPKDEPWESIVVSPDGHTFAAVAWDRLEDAWLHDLDSPTWKRRLSAHQSKGAAFAPHGALLAVAWMDDALVHDLSSGRETRYRGHSNTLSALAFSPSDALLATVGHDRKLRLWDTESATERYAVVAHQDWVRCVAFAPDGWSLATGGDDGLVRLWHTRTGQLLLELPQEGAPIRRVRFGPRARRIACVTADDHIVVYDSTATR